MRFLSLLSLMLASTSAFAAYDNSWYKAEFWSYEWPHGFSVAKAGVKVPGRTAMDKDLNPTISCELPVKAVFNPWNFKRTELSNVRYHTASKIVKLVAKEDFTFQEDSETPSPVAIKKGDVIEYLIYGAEGYFTIRIAGKEYGADQSFLEKMEEVSQDAYVQEEWLELDCVNGGRAWIFFGDLGTMNEDGELKYIDGLWNASIGNPGVDDYGHARDLTDEEIKGGK